MGNLVAADILNVRHNPVDVLDIAQFTQIADYIKNGVPSGTEIVPVIGIGIFLSKRGKQELIFDFKIGVDDNGEDIFVGRDGGSGTPPLFPVKK